MLVSSEPCGALDVCQAGAGSRRKRLQSPRSAFGRACTVTIRVAQTTDRAATSIRATAAG